ncbi:hypothetical protein H7I40_21735 [Mycolicibacterium madagascariense]|nr:hypothetical protein [Mycolicibacterium madagascariense]
MGAGVAQAGSTPDVVGQKYSDAQTAITGAGLTPVISTIVGDQLTQPNCQVVNTVPRTVPAPENTSGSPTQQLLVSLNCDNPVASATKPGFSAASPQGQSAIAAASSSAAASSASAAASASPSS